LFHSVNNFFRARELGVTLIETSLTSLHSLLITVITYHRMPSMVEEQIRGSANDNLPMLPTCLFFLPAHQNDTSMTLHCITRRSRFSLLVHQASTQDLTRFRPACNDCRTVSSTSTRRPSIKHEHKQHSRDRKAL
jgi:hypothetical protein